WPDGSTQLYDHWEDPEEEKNLSGVPEYRDVEEEFAHHIQGRIPGPELEARKERSDELPNIIIILADDLGYEDLGVHHSPEAVTPHLDSLANNGIQCRQAYITAPVCSPSRAGLLTGRYQNRFGFEFLASEEAIMNKGQLIGLPEDEVTLADRMKALGYVTGCIGKWHLGKEPSQNPTRRGFDLFYGTLGQSGYFEPMLYNSDQGSKPKRVKTPGYYVTDDYSRRAVQFVEDHHDQPFFLYLSHFAVHKPHLATERYLERFAHIEDSTRKAYLAMLSAMDDGVGDLLEALREHDLEERTLLLFLSDNGGTQGSSNRPLRGKKGGTWEGGIRTPFFVQWKGRLPPGGVFPHPVSSLDLAPTCLAAAGESVPQESELDGVNLLPYLEGRKSHPPHDALYWKFGTQWAIRKGDWKLLQAREGKGGNIQIAKEGPIRLFHLGDDPEEANDLFRQEGQIVQELSQLWDTWAERLPEPRWLPFPVGNSEQR
ncbi:MAG: sulfatase-like hydrolase/transferase, partial [Verrucomicrobiota bacterium]